MDTQHANVVKDTTAVEQDDLRKVEAACDTTSAVPLQDEVPVIQRLRERVAARTGGNAPNGMQGREQQQQPPVVIDWPGRDPQPICGYTCYRAFAKASPKLFPYGDGDVTSAGNTGSVSLEKWGQFLTWHHSG